MPLRDQSFVDLYIGTNFADMKLGVGAYAPRAPVPEELQAEVEALRAAIASKLARIGESECSYEHDGVMYRVTAMEDVRERPVYFLRRIEPRLWNLKDVRLPKHVVEHVTSQKTKGLILVSGAMGSGKTTTATAILAERLKLHGSFGLALEQPPEYELNGEHGLGRCIQVPVTRSNGGFGEQLIRAKRTSTSELLIGEIRCGETGAAAVHQTNIGVTVSGTIHAKSVVDAITQLEAFAIQGGMRNPLQMIAQGLSAVIHQQVDVPSTNSANRALMAFECLVIGGEEELAIRQKIADPSRIQQVKQDIDNQMRKIMYAA